MIWRLFDLWPTAEAAAGADEGAIGDVINVLGLFKRSATVKRFSQEYLSKQVCAFGASSIATQGLLPYPTLAGYASRKSCYAQPQFAVPVASLTHNMDPVQGCFIAVIWPLHLIAYHSAHPGSGMIHRCCARWAARRLPENVSSGDADTAAV